VVEVFLAQNEGFVLPEVAVASFSLYSSSLVDDVPVYRRQRSFRLVVPDQSGTRPLPNVAEPDSPN
jgi:hypothetical protein